MRGWSLLLSVAALSAPLGPAFALPRQASDPMAKTVTVRAKMVTMREALRQLSKASGLELGPRDLLGDLKVTVLVRDEPIGSVMARLADLFHAAWQANGPGRYLLAVPNTWNLSMEGYVAAENEERRKAALAKIKTLIEGASMPYFDVLATLRGDTSTLTPDQKAALEAVTSPEQYLLGATFAKMGPADFTQFWDGEAVRASDTLAPATGASPPPLPGAAVRRRGQPTMGRVVRAMAYYDPLTGHLQMGNAGRGTLSQNPATKLIEHPYPSGDSKFAKEVLAWNRIESDSPRWQTVVQAAMQKGSYFGGSLSMADAMEWLHDHSGVPIVADAFRVPVTMPRRGGSVGNWLAGFQESNSAFVRTEGGFVMVRHGGFWRLRTFDAPESLFTDLESSPHPSLDQYAAFAASLTRAQALPFRINGAALLKVDPAPLRDGMAALRFFATLSPDARRLAWTGAPIPFGQLDSASQTRFFEAMESPIGGTPIGAGAPDRTSDAVLRRLGFLMTPATIVRPTPPLPVVGGTEILAGPSTGISLLFGTAPNAGVAYLVPLDH